MTARSSLISNRHLVAPIGVTSAMQMDTLHMTTVLLLPKSVRFIARNTAKLSSLLTLWPPREMHLHLLRLDSIRPAFLQIALTSP